MVNRKKSRRPKITRIIAILIITSFAAIGTWQVFSSSAATSQYSIGVNTEKGCRLSGRIWNENVHEHKCQNKCRVNGTTFVARNAKTDRPAYCKGHVNTEINVSGCIDQLHRYYVSGLGCARKANQENDNNSHYCQPNYPNYIAENKTDRCVADKIVLPPANGGSNNPPITDNFSQEKCELLGRAWNVQSGTCSRVCLKEAGAILQDTTSKVIYCQRAVGNSITQTRCAQLHRKWADAGCARRIDQIDTNNALQCLSGYPYYNSNSEASMSDRLDVCEADKQTAVSNEESGVIGGVSVGLPGGGENPQEDGAGSVLPEGGCLNGGEIDPKTSACSEDNVINQDTDSTSLLVDSAIDKRSCALLGRQWQSRSSNSEAGCAIRKCIRKEIKIITNSGKTFCQGYAEKLTALECDKYHRGWVEAASVCAAYPSDKSKKKVIVSAEQCIRPHTSYIVHTNQEGPDECLKPSAVERLRSVAKTAGKPFTYVASLPLKGICNIRPGMTWQNGKCIKELPGKEQRVLVVGDSMTALYLKPAKFGKGWWGHLRDATGAKMLISAEGGSGFVRKGSQCKGTTFEDRIHEIKKAKPTFVIVAGGFNDGMYCENGQLKFANEQRIKNSIQEYMEKLTKETDALGMPRNNIYVFTPWGSGAGDVRDRVVPFVRASTERMGAHFVATPSLSHNQTIDGIHPTPAGSKFLYQKLVAESNIESRLRVKQNSEKVGDSLKVGTYNVLTSARQTELGGRAGYDNNDEFRMKNIAALIESEELDVVGTQEVRKPERSALLKHLPEYYNATALNHKGKSIDDVVFWDKRKFKEVGFGSYTIPKLGKTRNSMWVRLQSLETGKSVIVFNMHADLFAYGRTDAAHTVLNQIKQHNKTRNDPVIIMGDMNSNKFDPSRNEIFAVFNNSGKLALASDMTNNRTHYNCDTHNSPENHRQDCRSTHGSHIDQIWISKSDGIKVLSWRNIANSQTVRFSDHNPVVTRLSIPGITK